MAVKPLLPQDALQALIRQMTREPEKGASGDFGALIDGMMNPSEETDSLLDLAGSASSLMRLEMLQALAAVQGANAAPMQASVKASALAQYGQHSKPAGGHAPYSDLIAEASERYGLDADLIRSVIRAESNFDPQAVSSAGAQGLMQLMPATARELGVTDSFDAHQNIMAGTRYLKSLMDRYEGDVEKSLAAYNWGLGNIARKGTDSLPQETRSYVAKVMQYTGKG